MCGNEYLDQLPACIAPLAPSACPPRRACSPQEDALTRRTVHGSRVAHHDSQVTNHDSRVTRHQSLLTNHKLRITNHDSQVTNHAFRIGSTAIRNRRNPMKTNGGLPF
jgi:hypothetical protein